jgi:hypothetical protein
MPQISALGCDPDCLQLTLSFWAAAYVLWFALLFVAWFAAGRMRNEHPSASGRAETSRRTGCSMTLMNGLP